MDDKNRSRITRDGGAACNGMHSTPRAIRHRLAIAVSAVGAVAAFALPASASAAGAASVSSSGVLSYMDLTFATNHVTITPLGAGQYSVVDTAGVSNYSSCPRLSATQAKCSGVTAISVSLGWGDDDAAVNTAAATSPAVTLSGSYGNDTLRTGPGMDSITGGDGNDTIDPGAGADTVNAGAGADSVAVRDGVADEVWCGTGDDTGLAEAADQVDSDCEALAGAVSGTLVGAPPVIPEAPAPDAAAPASTDDPSNPGTSTPIGPVDPQANPLPVVIPTQSVKLDSKGDAVVRVACPSGEGHCKGTVTLEVAQSDLGKARAAAAASKLVEVGKAGFVAEAGAKPLVRVRLSRRGRRRVLRGRKKQRCRITVSTTSPTGKTLVTRRTITLVAERRTAKRAPKPPKRGSKR